MIVEEREYARLLGYPWGALLEGDVRERAEEAALWFELNAKPRVYCALTPLPGKGGVAAPIKNISRSHLSGRRRSGSSKEKFLGDLNHPPRPRLSEECGHYYDGASTPPLLRRGVVAAITAGSEVDREVERLWEAGRVDEAYFLDRYAAAVVEKLAADLGSHRSPGTGGMPLEEQFRLFAYIAPLNPEMELLSSGMLRPKNSLLTVGAVYDRPGSRNPCLSCHMPSCTFRRTTA